MISISAEQVKTALNNLNGEIHANTMSVVSANSRYARGPVIWHFEVGTVPVAIKSELIAGYIRLYAR